MEGGGRMLERSGEEGGRQAERQAGREGGVGEAERLVRAVKTPQLGSGALWGGAGSQKAGERRGGSWQYRVGGGGARNRPGQIPAPPYPLPGEVTGLRKASRTPFQQP